MIRKSNIIRNLPIPDKLIADAIANRDINYLPSITGNKGRLISPVKSIKAIAHNILQEILTPLIAVTTAPDRVVSVSITSDDKLMIALFAIIQELNYPLGENVLIFRRKIGGH